MVVVVAMLGACGGAGGVDEPTGEVDGALQRCKQDRILLPGNSVFPEGVARAADGRVFAGSFAEGTIFRAERCAAQATVFAALEPGLGAVGMLYDDARGVLWVCGSSFTGAGPALFGFDGHSGQLRARHPFATGFGLCNDLAIDGAGNLYLSESFMPAMMKIAAADALSNSPAAVWAVDPAWATSAPGAFGLNGIVADGAAIYTVHSEQGALYRVPIQPDGSPGTVQQIALTAPIAPADGLRLRSQGRILVIQGGPDGGLTQVTVRGASGTVDPVTAGMPYATSAVLGAERNTAWVVLSQFDRLFGWNTTPVEPFELVRVDLP